MRWDLCYGDGGASNRVFACNSNTGTERLVVSFRPSQTITQVTGLEVAIDAQSSSATLPSWWQLRGGSQCRDGQLGTNSEPALLTSTCVDAWQGLALAGVPGFSLYYPAGTDRLRIILTFSLPRASARTVVSGTEYYGCNVIIGHAKTVGTAACSGCLVPVCLLASQVVLRQPVGVGNVFLSESFAPNSALVGWQGGEGIVTPGSPNPVISACSNTTAANRPTWGVIRSLYR